MRREIREATPTTKATPVAGKPGRFLIQLISPGWGSSGFYSQAVLEAAAVDKVFPARTHMYVDHPTRTEEYDRPERTIRDLAAVLAEDARWDDGLKALVAEARVFGEYRVMLDELADDIGTSIRSWCESEPGEADGKNGTIITSLVEGISCDFVTHAGRGGKILQVIESARATREATANDTRDQLNAELTETYGTADVYVYVMDFDTDAGTVWFRQCGADTDATYAQQYTLDATSGVTLDGAPVEVKPVTTFVPIDPVGQPTTSQEDKMPKIEIEEAAHTDLVERAGRVKTLETERDAAVKRAEEAEATIAKSARGTTVARIMRESLEAHEGVELDDYQRRGVAADAVVKDGTVDEAATRLAFDKALDKLAETASTGRGKIRNLGGPVGGGTTTATESDTDPYAVMDAMAAESFTGSEALDFDLQEA